MTDAAPKPNVAAKAPARPAVAVQRPGPPQLARPPARLQLEQEKLRLVVFGDAGVGKTTLAGSFPRPLFIDTDGGLVTLAVQGETPLAFEPTGYKELEGLFWWMKEHRDEFDTIVVDSLTTMQRLLLDEIHDMALPTKTVSSPVMTWVPEQGEYQANQRQLARILTDLRRLNKHMVITSGVRDRMGKRAADCSPGLFGIVNHFASVMGELAIITHDNQGKPLPTPTRVLITGAGPREVKSRFRSLLPHVANPTYQELWKRVQAEYASVTTNHSKES